jgi:catechol 2,3-dioxygenase-like lactoylglutathione lyase family enzyme
MQLDSVQIGVANLEEATTAYELLLTTPPLPLPGGRRRFQLARGAVELDTGTPGLHSIAFVATADSPLRAVTPDDTFNGIAVRVDAAPAAGPAAGVSSMARSRWSLQTAKSDRLLAPAIDHVVVQTTAPDRAIALWRDRFGLRLALDREFPDRGLRLLFFRSGGITLEYACVLAPAASSLSNLAPCSDATRSGPAEPTPAAGPDRLYGVSYRVPQLREWRDRLVAAGVDVSAIRPGMRPGTSVCTVRSGTAGVPTLLLEAGREGLKT